MWLILCIFAVRAIFYTQRVSPSSSIHCTQVRTEVRTQHFPNYITNLWINKTKPDIFYIHLVSNKEFPFQKVVLHKNKRSQVRFSNSASSKLGMHEKAQSTFLNTSVNWVCLFKSVILQGVQQIRFVFHSEKSSFHEC